jgi:hypothetical protein
MVLLKLLKRQVYGYLAKPKFKRIHLEDLQINNTKSIQIYLPSYLNSFK